MEQNIKYIDEKDKSYGVAGMAMSVFVWDADNMLDSVTLDGDSEDSVVMTQEYYFGDNRGFSAKESWRHTVEHFQLSVAMMVANVLCRCLVNRGKAPSAQLRSQMLAYALEEGEHRCSLQSDEASQLFDKCYNYCYRLFNHPDVCKVADEFAEVLRQRRSLSHADILETLAPLSRL